MTKSDSAPYSFEGLDRVMHEKARLRLEPSLQKDLVAARTMEPSLAEMYFRVFEESGAR